MKRVRFEINVHGHEAVTQLESELNETFQQLSGSRDKIKIGAAIGDIHINIPDDMTIDEAKKEA